MAAMLETLIEFACYFAPTLVAAVRKSQGRNIVMPSLGMFAMLNVVIAWTVFGWFLLMANALGLNPVAGVVKRIVGNPSGPPGFDPRRPPGQAAAGGSSTVTCGSCGGNGSIPCSTCQGRGSWYTQPTTANGTAQLQTCGACMSSGKLRCMGCGGSGRVLGPMG